MVDYDSEVPQSNATTPDRPRRGRRAVQLVKVALLVAVLAFAAAFVVREWDAIVAALSRLRWEMLVGAFVFALISLMTSVVAWRAILAGLGSRLPILATGRVFFLGQLGKYLPGGVWPVVAQAELSREYGVPRSRSASTSLVHMLLTLVVGIVVATVTLSLVSGAVLSEYWWLSLIGIAGAGLLAPPAFNRLIALAFRLIRRPRPEPVGARDLAVACLWVTATWVALGTHMWLLVRALAPEAPDTWLIGTGAFALAWVAGFVVVFLPAGAGAREAALALALSPVMGPADAVALALISRVLLLVADFAMAGVAVLAEKRRGRWVDDLDAVTNAGAN